MRSIAVVFPRSGFLLAALIASLGSGVSAATAAWNQPVGGASPINKSSGLGNAGSPSLAPIGGVPYVAWSEPDGTNSEIRVARLAADGTVWEKVADSASPINESPVQGGSAPSLADVGGVPYVAWHESDGFTNRVRVARLNGAGTSWQQPVGGATGINRDPAAGANGASASITEIGGVPYVAWTEFDVNNPVPANRNLEIRVAFLNDTGPSWDSVGETDDPASPINASDGFAARNPSLTAVGGVPWVAWAEDDGTNSEIRVARLNGGGTGWEQPVGGASPINQSPTGEAFAPSLKVIGGRLYVAWTEDDGTNDEVRVAQLSDDGTAWLKVGQTLKPASPINEAPDGDAQTPTLSAIGGVPYVAWTESDGTNREVRVARLNDAGTGWEQVVGGASPINQSPTMEASPANLAAIGGVPYVAWPESDTTNFELRVARLEPEFVSRNASPTDTGATLSTQVRTFGLPYPVGFEYGSSLESETTPTVAPTGQGNQVTVSQQVSGLTPSTAYAFRPFASAGVAAPRVLGSLGTFATTATPAPPAPPEDPQPPPDTPAPGDPPKPESDIAIGKAKLNVRKGTAKLPVAVPGAGSLDLAGRGLERARKEAIRGGTVNLPVRPKPKLERKLDDEGKAKVRVDVTYTPAGGEPNSESATLNLKQR